MLADAVSDEGRLGSLLAFATGMEVVPPLGFEVHPEITFGHDMDLADDPTKKFPFARTCSNSLRLPVLRHYDEFKNNMSSAISMAVTVTLA
jgi:HECT-domain (ubiquitin-transferase)